MRGRTAAGKRSETLCFIEPNQAGISSVVNRRNRWFLSSLFIHLSPLLLRTSTFQTTKHHRPFA